MSELDLSPELRKQTDRTAEGGVQGTESQKRGGLETLHSGGLVRGMFKDEG